MLDLLHGVENGHLIFADGVIRPARIGDGDPEQIITYVRDCAKALGLTGDGISNGLDLLAAAA